MDGDLILEGLFDKVKKIPSSLYLPLAIGLVGFVFFGIGLIELLKPPPQPVNLPVETETKPPVPVASLTVDVEGAVQNPGVYHVQSTGRMQDALIAAGGLSSNADREYVSKKINLAAKLVDGGKVYIPSIGENQSGSSSETTTVLGDTTSQIDINSASADTLDSLPGVGLATAQKIIAGRPYSNVEELLAKKVVSQKVFNEIKDKVVAQ